MRRALLVMTLQCLVAVAAMGGLLTAPAHAQDNVIEGDPLTITTSDDGRIQVRFSDEATGEFSRGDLGVIVEPGAVVPAEQKPFGFAGKTDWTLISRTPGTSSEEEFITSVYRAPASSPQVEVQETLSYQDGFNAVTATYRFRNLNDASQTVSPRLLADAAPGGNTEGTGLVFTDPTPGDPRNLRVHSPDHASLINVHEIGPDWAHYELGNYATLSDKVRVPQDFGDTAEDELHDAGFGVQWAPVTLGPSSDPSSLSDPHSVEYSFARRLRLTPPDSESAAVGEQQVVFADSRNESHGPQAAQTLHYLVEGPNPREGTVETNLQGVAQIPLEGEEHGVDTLTVYEDVDQDGSFDADVDIFQQADVAWREPPEPAAALAHAMTDELDGPLIQSASYDVEPPGTPNAGPANKVLSVPAGGFPRAGGAYALLTSGNGDGAVGSGGGTSGNAGNAARGAFDVSILKLDLLVPATANCLSLDLRFLSSESPEPGNPYNDSFIAELDPGAGETWHIDNDETIVAPRNFAADPQGRPLSVGGTGVTEMTPAGAAGTNYDVGTGLLRARTPVTPGPHTVYLSMFDVGDEIVDSAALLDKLEAVAADPGECVARIDSAQAVTRAEVNPASASRPTGEQHSVAVEAFDAGDTPRADPLVRYFVSGANPVADAALSLGSDGRGSVSWTGSNAGDDVLTIYRDGNGNGRLDQGEQLNSASVGWTAPQVQPRVDPPGQPEISISLAPGDESALTGNTHRLEASVLSAGGPLGGAALRYRVEGQHPSAGQATTGADGKAAISVQGTKPGQDVVTAFVDVNGDAVQGAGEPAAIARIEWLDAPVLKKTANADPVAGTVLVKLPRGTSLAKARSLGLAGATNGFIPLTEAKEVPLGSTFETTRGRVELQTVSSSKSPDVTQTGDFYEGRFQVRQVGSSRAPITEAILNEPLECRSSGRRGREVTAARRSRRLWGNGRGRFRTRGRYSSATVRGTEWLTKDSCTTTTTRVKSGTVIVRDIAKKKNVTVKRGRSYVARARRR
jgi:hypothetical protein